MKKLSSDLLYYKSLAILIIGPFLFFILIQLSFYKSTPLIIILIMYALLAIIFLRGWLNTFKFKKIAFTDKKLIITSYFRNESVEIPIYDVKSIEEVYTILSKKQIAFYKILFNYENKVQKVLFYKSLKLFSIVDLERYIGLEKNVL